MVPLTFATQIVLPPSSNSLASPSAGSSDSVVSLRKGIWFRAVRDCQVCARGCQTARDCEKSAGRNTEIYVLTPRLAFVGTFPHSPCGVSLELLQASVAAPSALQVSAGAGPK